MNDTEGLILSRTALSIMHSQTYSSSSVCLSYNYVRRRLFLFGKNESVWPSYSAVRCIITCSGSLKCLSNIVWRPFMVSRDTADYFAVSNVSSVLLSVIMQFFCTVLRGSIQGFPEVSCSKKMWCRRVRRFTQTCCLHILDRRAPVCPKSLRN